MKKIKENLFEYVSIGIGLLTLILLGWNSVTFSSGGISGWNMINFDIDSTAATFSALFNLFAFIIALCLLFIGINNLMSKCETSNDKCGFYNAKAICDKLKFNVWAKWLIVGYAGCELIAFISLAVFCGEQSGTYTSYHVGFNCYLMLLIGLISSFFLILLPLITKAKEKNETVSTENEQEEEVEKEEVVEEEKPVKTTKKTTTTPAKSTSSKTSANKTKKPTTSITAKKSQTKKV